MTEIRRWTVSEPYLKLDCGLGEAPFYEKSSHSLRFVDIVKEKLHVLDLDKGPSSLKTFNLETAVSTTADIEGTDNEIVVGAKYGYAFMDRKTGKLAYVKKVWTESDGPGKETRMRLNDGAVDSRGRYWAGAMNDPKVTSFSDEGVLFRLDPDLKLHRVIEKVTIPNGIGWTKDDKIMYFIDTPTMNIFKFDYDISTGDISNKRVFFHYDGAGGPDGFVLDSEGYLWVAICGGGKVLRISPDGKIVGEISLPTRMISCPAFAGEELFLTSAEEEDPNQYPESVKYAGSIFKVNVGVSGAQLHEYKRSSNASR